MGRGQTIDAAWNASFLADLPPAPTEELLATAHEQEFSAGHNVYRELVEPRFVFVGLLTSGMLRIYTTSPGDRRITIRYVRPGGVVGLTSMLRNGGAAGAEAVTTGSVLRFDPITFRRLAKTNASVGWALANELAEQVAIVSEIRQANVFGSVRARVAWHLLELATERGGRLVVKATQQQLADSIGSVREVVARVMVQLRKDGVIERDGNMIVVQDRERLAEIAHGAAEPHTPFGASQASWRSRATSRQSTTARSGRRMRL